MLGILRMIVVGLIVGILARFFYPGAIHMGFILTVLLGIAGSIVGGFIARLFSPRATNEPFHPAGFLLSILGGMILIFLAHLLHIG
ncbi:MAG: GlsB/YeaQ/YmgE family stress response membrane protein [Pseudomonadota bacterium]|nr:GlsB/YeaQ/YmgE family stress response membrane protein [Pseudomonadota bacterium]